MATDDLTCVRGCMEGSINPNCDEHTEAPKEREQAAEEVHEIRDIMDVYITLNPAPSETVLQEAARLTSGERQQSYGPPAINHRRTAEMVRAYLKAKYNYCPPLNAEDICLINVLQKMSRRMHSESRDSLVDIAGYIDNIERIEKYHDRASVVDGICQGCGQLSMPSHECKEKK